jgi:hypothetical protein
VTTPDEYHEFFTAAAGVAGALVGLLFVAVSVTMERMEEQGETQIHRIRAATALTAFSNALTVSLFALIPNLNIGWPAFVVAAGGILFVLGALLSMLRLGLRRPGELRNALFLVGLVVLLVFQLLAGIRLINQHGAYQTISILVVFCFLIGISRSWELIGGPSIGTLHELFVFGRKHRPGATSHRGEGDRASEDSEASPDGGTESKPTTRDRPPGEAGSVAGS